MIRTQSSVLTISLRFCAPLAAVVIVFSLSAPVSAQSGTDPVPVPGKPIRPAPNVIEKAELFGNMEELRQHDPRLYDRLRRERQSASSQSSEVTPLPHDILPQHNTVAEEAGQVARENAVPGAETETKGE